MKNISNETLYAKDAHGTLRIWSISLCENPGAAGYFLLIKHGVDGGELQEQVEYIDFGLASRTSLEQAISRFNSRINKKKDSGYVRDKMEAIGKKRTNALGFPKPMLAQKFNDMRKKINWYCPVYAQRKYNGHRCLVIIQDGVATSYTRGGKVINSIKEILSEIENYDLPNGTILDGELYIHGEKLQSISSYIKKRGEKTPLLQYIIYDVVDKKNYGNRLNFLNEAIASNSKGESRCFIAQTQIVKNEIEALEFLNESIQEGYEGVILRQELGGYEDGKRSQRLIKMKKAEDKEFKITDITASTEGWAILHCKTEKGAIFKVSAPGTFEEKREVLLNSEKYINKYVNVSYFDVSNDGKPLQAVANYFMDAVSI